VSLLVVEVKTGVLVPEGDDAALAERVLRLVEDPERGREMGEEGRRRALRRFGRERLFRDMVAIYDELLEKRGVSSFPPGCGKAE
jgi:starch synthase